MLLNVIKYYSCFYHLLSYVLLGCFVTFFPLSLFDTIFSIFKSFPSSTATVKVRVRTSMHFHTWNQPLEVFQTATRKDTSNVLESWLRMALASRGFDLKSLNLLSESCPAVTHKSPFIYSSRTILTTYDIEP